MLVIIFAVMAVVIDPSIMTCGAGVLLIALVRMGMKEKQAINPYYLFLSTPLAVIMYSHSVSRFFLPELQVHTQWIIVGGIYAYFAGLLTLQTGGRFKRSTTLVPRSSFDGLRRLNGSSSLPVPRYSFAIVLALGLIPHVLGVATAGIPILANDVNAARAAYILPIIGQFTIFLPVTMLIAFQERKKWMIAASISLNLFFNFIGASKLPFLFAGLFFFYAYFRYNGAALLKVKPAYLVIAGLVAIPVLFATVFSLRDGSEQIVYFWRSQIRFHVPVLDALGDYTYLPYLYLTTPLSNFGYITEINVPSTGGARTIYALASVFQLDGLLNVDELPIRRIPFNTHAYMTDFYVDFGTAGVLILSYLLGLLVKWSYANALSRPDFLSEGIWISVGFASFVLFFSNHFTGQAYPLLTCILFSLYRVAWSEKKHHHESVA
jgi:oligosaccharide repeat unit polymerase